MGVRPRWRRGPWRRHSRAPSSQTFAARNGHRPPHMLRGWRSSSWARTRAGHSAGRPTARGRRLAAYTCSHAGASARCSEESGDRALRAALPPRRSTWPPLIPRAPFVPLDKAAKSAASDRSRGAPAERSSGWCSGRQAGVSPSGGTGDIRRPRGPWATALWITKESAIPRKRVRVIVE